MKKGKVILVGAGPGDPSLITLAAIKALKKATVIFYDYLANDKLLDYVSNDCKRIYVGKKGALKQSSHQKNIEKQMIHEAQRGATVVRLKGGDPYIFGRGGEEALAIQKAGLHFEIIPGISSAIAVPAYAGIPLTHRDINSEFVVLTGHEPEKESSINWKAISQIETIVILMGHKQCAQNTKRLIEEGRSPKTKAALISWGTYTHQKTIVGNLSNIADLSQKEGLKPPTVLVIGDLVQFRKKLQFFEKKKFFGKRFCLTRSDADNLSLKHRLEEEGAECDSLPLLYIKDYSAQKVSEIQKIKDFSSLIFTSRNAVDSFMSALNRAHMDLRDCVHLKVFSVGPKTSERIRSYGLWVDCEPQKNFSAKALIKEIKKQKNEGPFFFPRAKDSRVDLINFFKDSKIKYRAPIFYESYPSKLNQAQIKELLSKNYSAIVFYSPAAVKAFLKNFRKESQVFFNLTKIICFGKSTIDFVKSQGYESFVSCRDNSEESLFRSLIKKRQKLSSV